AGAGVRWVSACPTTSGPSTTRDSASSGPGTTSADHTVIDRPSSPGRGGRAGRPGRPVRVAGAAAPAPRLPARRATTFPTAHDAAAASVTRNARAGVDALRPAPTTTSPAAP